MRRAETLLEDLGLSLQRFGRGERARTVARVLFGGRRGDSISTNGDLAVKGFWSLVKLTGSHPRSLTGRHLVPVDQSTGCGRGRGRGCRSVTERQREGGFPAHRLSQMITDPAGHSI
jgi:hypothetical protein